ncbi:MAG: HAD family hydrolase [Methanopyri archaeon]|jgi:putative hydrolase of the HAD superfamily|nr:HAD family hydrolase [Methanopyri archaeon]
MLVLFDLDGTLLDLSLLAAVLRESIVRMVADETCVSIEEAEGQLAGTEDELRRQEGKVTFFRTKVHPDEDPLILLNQALQRVAPAIDAVGAYGRIRTSCASPPFPDALPCLKALKARGHTVGVCTNTIHEKAVRELMESGLTPHVVFLVAGDDAGHPLKGDPLAYQHKLEELVEKYGDVLVVGDVVSLDLVPAHETGCRTCLVVRDYTPNRSCELPWLDHVVSSLAEVPPLTDREGPA